MDGRTPARSADVLVVGAGPTGMTLAIDLLRRGVEVRIIDRSPDVFEGSRAKGVQPRTLEVLDDLGVVEEVLQAGGYPPSFRIHLGRVVTVPFRPPRKRSTPAVPYPNIWILPQSSTARALHARFEELGGIVAFGRELVDLSQDDDAVIVSVAGDDGRESITARYVVGADGGSSVVRKRLGIDFIGSTDEDDRVAIVDAVTEGLVRDRWHLWLRRGGMGLLSACSLPHSDVFQWTFPLAPDEIPAFDEGSLNRRIRAHAGDDRITLREVRWASIYRPNVRLASRFRSGRVFIGGDAAHVHTPAGGQGLNTGIQDAYNLGWKLGQVLAGADPALLNTYEAERRPIAEAVLGLSSQKYEGMRRLRPSSFRRGKEVKQLDLTYRGGPLAPTGTTRTNRLAVGDRAPDAQLRTANGERIRLHDLLRGPHFTAVAYGPQAARVFDDLAWPTTGAQLNRVAVTCEEVNGGATHRDHDGTLKRAYGIDSDALILIRPDGYIAGIATNDFAAAVEGASRLVTPPADRARPNLTAKVRTHPTDQTEWA